MASEKMLGYAEVLADMEAKRAALDTAITALRAALTLGALGQPGDAEAAALLAPAGGSGLGGPPVELPHGALLGKSLPAAIKLYLSAMKRKQTVKEIATALRDGGVESTSSNFENIVTGALHRLRGSGDVLRFKDGWALAEFYPENMRARLAQGEAKPRKKQRARKAKPKRAPAAEEIAELLRSAS